MNSVSPGRMTNGLLGDDRIKSHSDCVRSTLGVQLCIPVQEIEPALMQVIRRETTAMGVHFLGRWLARLAVQLQPALAQAARTFAQVARAAGCHHVLPACHPSPCPRYNVIERQITFGAAILATKLIPQEKIKAREGHALLRLDEIFQHHHRRDAYLGALASDRLVIFGNDDHPVQIGGLYRFLPRPKRQWVIGQGAVIGIQYQGREMPQRGRLSYKIRSEITIHGIVQIPCVGPSGWARGREASPLGLDYISRLRSDKPLNLRGGAATAWQRGLQKP